MMETKTLTKGIFAFILLCIYCFTASATSPRNYLEDVKSENGKMVSKVIYVEKEGFAKKEFKYEFIYNNEGKVFEKKGYRWNSQSKEWMPSYRISYSYDKEANMINSNYGMWDQKKQEYSLYNREICFPMKDYESIFS